MAVRVVLSGGELIGATAGVFAAGAVSAVAVLARWAGRERDEVVEHVG